MSFPLAIVVPAYKLRFFSRVLDSLAAQTDKRFTLYVGIDGVDADFESVASRYAAAYLWWCAGLTTTWVAVIWWGSGIGA